MIGGAVGRGGGDHGHADRSGADGGAEDGRLEAACEDLPTWIVLRLGNPPQHCVVRRTYRVRWRTLLGEADLLSRKWMFGEETAFDRSAQLRLSRAKVQGSVLTREREALPDLASHPTACRRPRERPEIGDPSLWLHGTGEREHGPTHQSRVQAYAEHTRRHLLGTSSPWTPPPGRALPPGG